MRHCEFCGGEIPNTREKFGQNYFYTCPHCETHCSSLETLRKYNPNIKPLQEGVKNEK